MAEPKPALLAHPPSSLFPPASPQPPPPGLQPCSSALLRRIRPPPRRIRGPRGRIHRHPSLPAGLCCALGVGCAEARGRAAVAGAHPGRGALPGRPSPVSWLAMPSGGRSWAGSQAVASGAPLAWALACIACSSWGPPLDVGRLPVDLLRRGARRRTLLCCGGVGFVEGLGWRRKPWTRLRADDGDA